MKKDVYEYFTQMQLQYNQMLKILEKVNIEISEGKVSDSQRENFEKYFATVQSNYERVAYIVHLLALPPKFIRRLKEKKIKNDQERFLKSNLDSIKKENSDALEGASDLIAEKEDD